MPTASYNYPHSILSILSCPVLSHPIVSVKSQFLMAFWKLQGLGLAESLEGRVFYKVGKATEKTYFQGPMRWQDFKNRVWSVLTVSDLMGQAVTYTTRSNAMWSFKGDYQHLELHLEGNWKPGKLTQWKGNMGEPMNIQYYIWCCILNQL